MTALLWAAPFGNKQMIQLLLDKGADPGIRDYRGMNALELAATSESQNPEVIRLLLAMAKRGDVNAKDKNGMTALDWARKWGDTDFVRLLREAGAAES